MDEAKRKEIEKAVVELKGDFCSEIARHKYTRVMDYLVMQDEYIICTIQEFEQVKAGMQNKPSWDDAPEWAKWLGQCSSGHWEWYEDKPKPSSKGLYWAHGESKGRGAQFGKVIGDWSNTLEKRPKPNLDDLSAKEPTPELRELMRGDWHERGELPPVGEVVEYNKKMKVRILGHHPDGDAIWHEPVEGCFPDGASYSTDSAFLFRPLRTQRDELVDELDSLMNSPRQRRAIAEEIVDLGWRPPKN